MIPATKRTRAKAARDTARERDNRIADVTAEENARIADVTAEENARIADVNDARTIANNAHTRIDNLGFGNISGNLNPALQIADFAIPSAKMGDNAVNERILGSHATDNLKRAVTREHLRNAAVGTQQIENYAVTAIKINLADLYTELDARYYTRSLANDRFLKSSLHPLFTTGHGNDHHDPDFAVSGHIH